MQFSMYGIQRKSTGNLMGITIEGQPDGAEFCSSYVAELEENSSYPYLVSYKSTAQKTLDTPSPWWDAGLSSPRIIHYDRSDLVVVKVTLNVEQQV